MECKFKVGDKIKILDTSKTCNSHTLKVGDVTKIVSLQKSNTHNGKFWLRTEIDPDRGILESNVELYQEDIKFKTGDIVVCLPEPNKNPGNADIKGGAGYASNLCFKATSIHDISTSQVLWGGIDACGVYSNSLRYATQKEIDEYNKLNKSYYITDISKPKSLVGRYLKALVDHPNAGRVKAGEIGIIIKELDGRPDFVDFPSQKGYSIGQFTYDQGESYQLMPEGFHPDQVKEEWVPKVGDWVRVTTDCYVSHKTTKNPVFQIQSISDGNKLHSKETGNAGWIWLKDVVKAEPHEIPVESKQQSPNLDLLEEAKRRYPVGTEYRCATGGMYDESTVEEDTIWKFWDDECTKIDAMGKYFVYYKGKWAEIVSLPESKLDIHDRLKPQFKVGDKVRVLSESDGWGSVKKGDIGVVREIHSTSLSVDFPNQSFWEGKPECFELVEEGITIPPVLKVSITTHPVTYNEAYKKPDILPDIALIKSNRLDTKVKNTYVTLPEIKKKNKTIKF